MLKKVLNWLLNHDTMVIATIAGLLFTRYAVGLMFKLCLFAFVAYSFYYFILGGHF